MLAVERNDTPHGEQRDTLVLAEAEDDKMLLVLTMLSSAALLFRRMLDAALANQGRPPLSGQ